MFTPTAVDKEALEKLANYLALGIDPTQSRLAVGFSQQRLSSLMQDQEFIDLIDAAKGKIAHKYVDTNQFYDDIEKRAAKNILEILQFSKDEDFNLRAMALANRATRRGLASNPALQAPGAGTVVNLNLSVKLQQAIQNGEMRTTPVVLEGEKDTDIATPEMVEAMVRAADNLLTAPVAIGQEERGRVVTLQDFMPIDV